MKAQLTSSGFTYNGEIIQGSYTFQNIQRLSETEHQDIYSALMKTPINVPCTITIVPNCITVVTIDGNNITIKY